MHFHRIAITKRQIREFILPIKLDKKTREKLEKDTRLDNFMMQNDDDLHAVELDALLAYKPDEFKESQYTKILLLAKNIMIQKYSTNY